MSNCQNSGDRVCNDQGEYIQKDCLMKGVEIPYDLDTPEFAALYLSSATLGFPASFSDNSVDLVEYVEPVESVEPVVSVVPIVPRYEEEDLDLDLIVSVSDLQPDHYSVSMFASPPVYRSSIYEDVEDELGEINYLTGWVENSN
jgi:hypothetical protein